MIRKGLEFTSDLDGYVEAITSSSDSARCRRSTRLTRAAAMDLGAVISRPRVVRTSSTPSLSGRRRGAAARASS